MPSTTSNDSPIGWILAALMALQILHMLVAAPVRADTIYGPGAEQTLAVADEHDDEVRSGWALRMSRFDSTMNSAVAQIRPVPAALPAALPPAPDVFGSVAVSMSKLAISGRWNQIITENAGRYFTSGCPAGKGPCGAKGWQRWRQTHAEASRKSGKAQLTHVNARVNALVRYTADSRLHGRADHWATLAETVTASAGDCEDIAIAKMWMLNALGVPLGNMQVVVLKDRRRGLDHAVLTVRSGGRTLVLDNVHDEVLEDHAIRHYQPVFSVSASGSWVHGFRTRQDQISSLSVPLRGSAN